MQTIMLHRYSFSFILILILTISTFSFSNERALYVDGFNSILGNISKENELLNFSQKNNFTTLILYELQLVRKRMPIDKANKINILANFISKAKTQYGLRKIIATGENGEIFINYFHIYNKTRKTQNERFDGYNLEYEFWNKTNSDFGGYYCENYLRKNGIPCNVNGSFNYFLETISILNLLKKEVKFNIEVEVYVPIFSVKQIQALKTENIKYRISAYADNPSDSFNNIKKSLKLLSKFKCDEEVSIIFSSELLFMKGYFNYNSLSQAEKNFKAHINQFEDINLVGFTYFKYTELKKSVEFEKHRSTGIKPKY